MTQIRVNARCCCRCCCCCCESCADDSICAVTVAFNMQQVMLADKESSPTNIFRQLEALKMPANLFVLFVLKCPDVWRDVDRIEALVRTMLFSMKLGHTA